MSPLACPEPEAMNTDAAKTDHLILLPIRDSPLVPQRNLTTSIAMTLLLAACPPRPDWFALCRNSVGDQRFRTLARRQSCVFHRPGETLIAVFFGVGFNLRDAGGLHRPDVSMVTLSLAAC
jgi:hypothetical protein